MNLESTIDPYKELNISKRAIENLPDEEIDKKILNMKNNLIIFLKNSIEYDKNPEKIEKINEKINLINEEYNLIKDTESRQNYQEKELMKKEKIQKYLKAKSLEEHIDEKLIKTNGKGKKSIQEIPQVNKDIYLEDYHGRNLRIREINQINYCNALGMTSTLYEYVVKRKINAVTRKNTIFSDINFLELSIGKDGDPINREYYDMVSNHLLSEENLFVAKNANYNYVGVVEKTNKGYNDISVKAEELTVASIIEKERNKSKEFIGTNKNSQEGDGR